MAMQRNPILENNLISLISELFEVAPPEFLSNREDQLILPKVFQSDITFTVNLGSSES